MFYNKKVNNKIGNTPLSIIMLINYRMHYSQ